MASTTFARMLNRTATIRRPALADAGHGASTQTLAVVGFDVPCALAPLSDRERATAAQLEVAYDHRLFTDAAADIRRGDRVEVAPPLVVEGREPVYRVVAVRDPGHRGHHLEAMLAQELD